MKGNQTLRRLGTCLFILTFLFLPWAQAKTALKTPTAQEFQAMNLFLSNFTEIGIQTISSASPDKDLVDFAHDHMWFNSPDRYSYGTYFSGNNCRVADTNIQSTIDAYFYDAPDVDVRQTRFDYKDGYYYHQETGGWTHDCFALTTSVCSLGDNLWYISFVGFGAGEDWSNEDLSLCFEQAVQKFGAPQCCGCALVYAADLSDRSTYKMLSFSRI